MATMNDSSPSLLSPLTSTSEEAKSRKKSKNRIFIDLKNEKCFERFDMKRKMHTISKAKCMINDLLLLLRNILIHYSTPNIVLTHLFIERLFEQ